MLHTNRQRINHRRIDYVLFAAFSTLICKACLWSMFNSDLSRVPHYKLAHKHTHAYPLTHSHTHSSIELDKIRIFCGSMNNKCVYICYLNQSGCNIPSIILS